MADVADLACALPGTGLACGVADAAQGVAGAAAGGVLDGIARSFVDGFAATLKASLSFWTRVGSDTAGAEAAIGALRADTAWAVGFVAVASLLIACIRLALSRNSAPAADIARQLVLLVVVTGVGVPAIAALWTAGDAYSEWVIGRAGGEDLGARLLVLTSAMTGGDVVLGPAAVVLLAGVGILASFAQVAVMVVRIGVLTLLSGLLPLFAAATGTRAGQQTFSKVVALVIAYALYKPAAATIYAGSFWLVGTGEDITAVLAGLALMVMSLAALPALLRLVAPAVTAATPQGGGGLTTAGVVIATGARAAATRTPPMPRRAA